jgi:arylsulfatase A-like enzyme
LLGAQGTTFSDFVVSYAECCPSRSTFLTGQYAHNHGVLSSMLPTGGASKFGETNSLATWLHDAGYYTALSGKYLNGYGTDVPASHVPPGWSDWFALTEPTTYQYVDYDVSVNGSLVHYGHNAGDYSTDVIAEHAEQVIRSQGGHATPLFLDVTPTGPHVPMDGLAAIPAPRHVNSLVGTQAPRSPSYNQPDVSTMPPWISSLPLLDAQAIKGVDNIYRLDDEALLSVDDLVARVYGALRDTGELDNTIFMFTSDNGYHYGDHRILVGKSDEYEESIRVPLLVRGPGFPAGRTVGQPTANIDLAPTITAATGVTPGRTADGVPLTGFVTSSFYGAHRPVVIENGPLLGRRTYTGVRDDRWVYIVSSTGDKELYDLANDPDETKNLAGQNSPTIKYELYVLGQETSQLRSCAGAACRRGIP